MEDMFWTGENAAWGVRPTPVKCMDADVWETLQEYSARIDGQSDGAAARNVQNGTTARNERQRAGSGGGTESSSLTSKSTQAQHQATSTLSPPHPTPPPTQHGLPTV